MGLGRSVPCVERPKRPRSHGDAPTSTQPSEDRKSNGVTNALTAAAVWPILGRWEEVRSSVEHQSLRREPNRADLQVCGVDAHGGEANSPACAVVLRACAWIAARFLQFPFVGTRRQDDTLSAKT